MNETKLKPCPFCGSPDKVYIRKIDNGYKVACGDCGSCGKYVAVKKWHSNKFIAQGQAVKAWNRRADNANL